MKSNNDQFPFRQQFEATSHLEMTKVQKGSQLALKIIEGMGAQGLSRQAFANLMGVQPSIITRWLNGTHNFTVDTLFEIESRLGIQLLAIERAASQKMSFRMSAESESTQHFSSSLIDGNAGLIPTENVTYFESWKAAPNAEAENAYYLDVLNLITK